jgi:uncharacterized Fe-S cluster protein YjdI
LDDRTPWTDPDESDKERVQDVVFGVLGNDIEKPLSRCPDEDELNQLICE